MFQRLGLPDSRKRLPECGLDQVQKSKSHFTVVLDPKLEILAKFGMKYSKMPLGHPDASTSPGFQAERSPKLPNCLRSSFPPTRAPKRLQQTFRISRRTQEMSRLREAS
jgi:hypothetical protein